jgi:hypothetical protein
MFASSTVSSIKTLNQPACAGAPIAILFLKENSSMKTTPKKAIKSIKTAAAKTWSKKVTRASHALELENHVFGLSTPLKIAQSLKRSALRSARRKSAPFRSAMSMLNFYINRAGKNLGASQLKKLEDTKVELRRLFNRELATK